LSIIRIEREEGNTIERVTLPGIEKLGRDSRKNAGR
jgi:hypothetical protein